MKAVAVMMLLLFGSIAETSVSQTQGHPEGSFRDNLSVGLLVETFSMKSIPYYDALQLLIPLTGKTELRLNASFENQWSEFWRTEPMQEEEKFLNEIRSSLDAVLHSAVAAVWQGPEYGQMSLHAGISGAAWFVIPRCEHLDDAVSKMSTSMGVFQAGLILGFGWSPHLSVRCGVEYQLNYTFAHGTDNSFYLPHQGNNRTLNAMAFPVAVHLAFKPF